jgi:hypothetical protein
VPADGNCLFAAFSCGLIGCDALAVELRHDAVRTVVGDWETYGILTESEDGNPYDNQLTYGMFISRWWCWQNDESVVLTVYLLLPQPMLSRATTYGGIAEVTALCSLYRCTLHSPYI